MKSVQKGYELPEESEIGMLFEKSAQRLSAAQQLLKSGFYEDAVGRAYYSMFFAAKAVLLKKEISVKTHRGLISAFGSAFVQQHLVETEYGKMLSIAEELREEVDYSITRKVDAEEASALIDDAARFLERMKQITQENDFLDN